MVEGKKRLVTVWVGCMTRMVEVHTTNVAAVVVDHMNSMVVSVSASGKVADMSSGAETARHKKKKE